LKVEGNKVRGENNYFADEVSNLRISMGGSSRSSSIKPLTGVSVGVVGPVKENKI
jgi:hypothetical protein